MSRLSLHSIDPQPAPEDGWRHDERLLARWVHDHSGNAALACVAAWLRRAESLGDSCLGLSAAQRCGSPGWSRDAIADLRRQPMVGDGSQRTPLVIDASARCYWWRSWRHETRIVELLAPRLTPPADAPPPQDLLDRLCADTDPVHGSAQRRAIASCTRQLLVVTGGPGTGKTRTALRLLLLRQLLAGAHAPGSALRVALAAPTGKAAHRLNMALSLDAAALCALDPGLLPACTALLNQPAQTVHRLLGWSPSLRCFRRGRERRLAADLVLVDEVSMLDLSSLRALCEALSDSASLVLLGDAEQLTSVASGSVLDDIVQALEDHPSGPVIRLQHVFRSDPQLLPALAAARQGDADRLLQLGADAPQAISYQSIRSPAELARRLQDWAARLAAAIAEPAAARGESAARRLLAAWQQRQLLCALREGRFGAAAASEHIDSLLAQTLGWAAHGAGAPGHSLIVLRNDYARGLFNGDTGVLLPDDCGRLHAWFPPAHDEPALRRFPPSELPEHASASALTVHKAQGSEYDHVALLLPPHPELALLDRQLVYTALSRARHGLSIWADESTLRAALQRRSLRQGGLRERLKQAL
jgi:exodeoxyribonuclease V alpha subunit